MKIHSLEVQDFRGIREANVLFGPGLTVLHGPNELGKSTLIEAIRAALFQQTSSVTGDEYVTWGCSTPACVMLTFEHAGKFWRVEKRFGYRRLAKLSCSDIVDAPRFRDVAEGNHVEGQLRDLLAWGIAPPGGRGAGPKLESFLLTALVGRQGEVQEIFETSLDKDRNDTGKALVTRALGALDKDPVLTTILERLTARVDKVFTSKDRRQKTSADSPLVALQQALLKQDGMLRDLREAELKGTSIRESVVRLQDERQNLLGGVEFAAATLKEARTQSAQTSARAELHVRINELQRQLIDIEQRTMSLASLESQLDLKRSHLVMLMGTEDTAATSLEDTRQQLQTAAETVARTGEALAHSGRVLEAARAQRRAELETMQAAAEARLKDVTAAEQAKFAASDFESQCEQAAADLIAAAETLRNAEGALELATISARLDVLSNIEDVATRARTEHARAQQGEQAARELLESAKTALAVAESRREGRDTESNSDVIVAAEAEVMLLRALEARIAINTASIEVQYLEESAERSRALRAEALARRSEASEIEQRIANRVLPNAERVSGWRELEREIGSSPLAAPAEQPSPAMPVAAGLLGGLMVVALAHMGLEWPLATAALTGLVVAATIGGLVGVPLRKRSQAQAVQHEQSARRRDRWAEEVAPSMRVAGIRSLADFEDAVAEVEGLRSDAQSLRAEADGHDAAAADAERTAAPLATRRERLMRLEREKPDADEEAMSAWMATFGTDVVAVGRRISEIEREIDETRSRLRSEAEATVRDGVALRELRQAAYDQAAREAASKEATMRLAQQHRDPAAIAALQARMEILQGSGASHPTVTVAMAVLETARVRHTTASNRAESLRAKFDYATSESERLANTLGADTHRARQEAEQTLHEIATALALLLKTPGNDANLAAVTMAKAQDEHANLERRLADGQAALAQATKQRTDGERAATELATDIALRSGQLKAADRTAVELRIQQAIDDPAFAFEDSCSIPLDPEAAQSNLERLQLQLERCTGDLNRATGQLTLIAGHVGSERLAQQEDSVALARAEVHERELAEKAALRLLREIEDVEAARATHLGRALAGPVTKAFRALTGERYGPISFGTDLRAEHIEAEGQSRKLEALSVGTREQLATLLRLAIAGHLKTSVILDDQLVHSDSARLAWFSERLRASARDHGHQIIVFTCRVADYLTTNPTTDEPPVALIDLAKHVHR